ncbi:MAG: SDR family NAD(P)-dependent oxidoreductase [Chloroflexi bacterium]|nr:SDR family NAD(P)-dependent oxidoreductase [Chloroflexota bacterium]
MILENRVTVVTGGGSGIGAAICRAFAAERARVAVTDLRPEAAEQVAGEIRAAGGQAAAWGLDVATRATVERAAEEIASRWGPVDVWVNNAGISRVVPFLECSDALWDLTLQVNLKGTFIGCQVALRQMLPRQRGVILNMSSQSGKAGNSHYAAYCASKFGIIGLTQSLAMEFAADGIRVNALCPGVVFTALWDEQHISDYGRKRAMKPEEVRPYLESKVPLGRLCTPEDVAQTAVFLASDAASYITGQAINISGGSVMN